MYFVFYRFSLLPHAKRKGIHRKIKTALRLNPHIIPQKFIVSKTILQCRKQVMQLKKIKAPLPELRKAQKARVNQAPRIKTAVTAVILPSALSLMKFRISPEFIDYFKTQIQNQEFLSRFSKFQRLFCHRKSRFFLPLCMPLIFRKRK